MKETKKDITKKLLITLIVILAFNFAGNYFFKRFDLTYDKRYTLSDTTLNIIEKIGEPVYIDVFSGR